MSTEFIRHPTHFPDTTAVSPSRTTCQLPPAAVNLPKGPSNLTMPQSGLGLPRRAGHSMSSCYPPGRPSNPGDLNTLSQPWAEYESSPPISKASSKAIQYIRLSPFVGVLRISLERQSSWSWDLCHHQSMLRSPLVRPSSHLCIGNPSSELHLYPKLRLSVSFRSSSMPACPFAMHDYVRRMVVFAGWL